MIDDIKMFVLSLLILIFSLGAQIVSALQIFPRLFGFPSFQDCKVIRFVKKHILQERGIFHFSVFAVFSLLIYYSYQQYIAWQSIEPSKFLLPPYQSIDYFIKYVGARFFAPYLISLMAAILFLFAAKQLNKKYEERFFEPEELWLGALALFIIGWPGLLFYFIGLILIYLIIHIFITFYYKFFFRVSPRESPTQFCVGDEVRVSLRLWWLPLAIFVIIINNWLTGMELWKLLKI